MNCSVCHGPAAETREDVHHELAYDVPCAIERMHVSRCESDDCGNVDYLFEHVHKLVVALIELLIAAPSWTVAEARFMKSQAAVIREWTVRADERTLVHDEAELLPRMEQAVAEGRPLGRTRELRASWNGSIWSILEEE